MSPRRDEDETREYPPTNRIQWDSPVVEWVLKTMGALFLSISMGIGGFALSKAYEVSLDHERLKERTAGLEKKIDASERSFERQIQERQDQTDRRITEVRDLLREMAAKLDRLREGKQP